MLFDKFLTKCKNATFTHLFYAFISSVILLVEETKDVVDSTDCKVSALQDQMASTQRDVRDIKDAVGAGK